MLNYLLIVLIILILFLTHSLVNILPKALAPAVWITEFEFLSLIVKLKYITFRIFIKPSAVNGLMNNVAAYSISILSSNIINSSSVIDVYCDQLPMKLNY